MNEFLGMFHRSFREGSEVKEGVFGKQSDVLRKRAGREIIALYAKKSIIGERDILRNISAKGGVPFTRVAHFERVKSDSSQEGTSQKEASSQSRKGILKTRESRQGQPELEKIAETFHVDLEKEKEMFKEQWEKLNKEEDEKLVFGKITRIGKVIDGSRNKKTINRLELEERKFTNSIQRRIKRIQQLNADLGKQCEQHINDINDRRDSEENRDEELQKLKTKISDTNFKNENHEDQIDFKIRAAKIAVPYYVEANFTTRYYFQRANEVLVQSASLDLKEPANPGFPSGSGVTFSETVTFRTIEEVGEPDERVGDEERKLTVDREHSRKEWLALSRERVQRKRMGQE